MRPARLLAIPRPGLWQHLLLAALLLGAQLLLAVHALDHLDSDAGDRCDICLVGQHLGHGQPVQHALTPVLPNTTPVIPAADAVFAEVPAPTPCQRGPPRTLRIV